MKTTCVTLVCLGHSGSTLLGMCLNSHSQIHAFGEFASLKTRFDRIQAAQKRGLCSFCYDNCAFLEKRETGLLKRCYHSRFHKVALAKSALTHSFYVKHLASRLGVRVICDTSKSAWWARFLNRRPELGVRQRFIFLRRDPRAVVASHVRKNRDLTQTIEKVRSELGRISALKAELEKGPRGRSLDIAYETLAKEPQTALRSMCEFLDLNFEPSMLEYDRHVHHIVGGNDKAKTRIKKQKNQRVNYRKPDIGWYLAQKDRFFIDERWKTELTQDVIERIGNEMKNEIVSWGYPVPVPSMNGAQGAQSDGLNIEC